MSGLITTYSEVMARRKRCFFSFPFSRVDPPRSVGAPEGKLSRKLWGINYSITGSKPALDVNVMPPFSEMSAKNNLFKWGWRKKNNKSQLSNMLQSPLWDDCGGINKTHKGPVCDCCSRFVWIEIYWREDVYFNCEIYSLRSDSAATTGWRM